MVLLEMSSLRNFLKFKDNDVSYSVKIINSFETSSAKTESI